MTAEPGYCNCCFDIVRPHRNRYFVNQFLRTLGCSGQLLWSCRNKRDLLHSRNLCRNHLRTVQVAVEGDFLDVCIVEAVLLLLVPAAVPVGL